jgi:hypothetical protein
VLAGVNASQTGGTIILVTDGLETHPPHIKDVIGQVDIYSGACTWGAMQKSGLN